MPLHRKHLLTEKKKILAAAALAKKIGYLKVTDLVPSGVVENLPTQSFNPHRIIGTKNKLLLVKEGSVEISHTHYDKLGKTLEPGMLFGYMALLRQAMIGPRAISATVGSVPADISSDTVKEWIKGNPLEVAQ